MSKEPTPPEKSTIKAPGAGGAFHRIKSLRCFKETREKLVAGLTLGKIADFVQIENGESIDIPKESLIAILHKFKKTIPSIEMAGKALPPGVAEAIKEVEEGLDELKALEDLYRLQLLRINIDHTIEKNIKKTLASVTQDVRVAKEILESVSRLKVEKGLTVKQLGTVKHEVAGTVEHTQLSGAAEKAIENPQSRRKILGMVQRLLNSSAIMDTAQTSEAQPSIPASDVDIDIEAVLSDSGAAEDAG